MAEIKIDIEKCKGCGLCVEICPQKCIVISEKFNSKGSHFAEFVKQDKCTGCSLCALVCPDVAIKVYR